MKMPLETFEALTIDDVVEAPGMLPGLSPEVLRLRVKSRTIERIEFVVTYFGVTLGNWSAHLSEGDVKWRT